MGINLLTPIICAVLLSVSYLIRPTTPEHFKGSAYECGFIPTEGQTYSPFTITFFVVGILFLLFDLELLFMLPLALTRPATDLGSHLGALVFFGFLAFSLSYEIGLGVILSFNNLRMLSSLALVFLVLGVAYLTLADRKGIASLQRRVGPNAVGSWGLLQPFADALKLLTKELIYLDQIISGLSQLLPLVTLSAGLAGYGVIPFGVDTVLLDLSLQVLVTLGLIGLALHGMLYMS